MGYDLGRRLTELKRQTDENLAERWRIGRTAFLCFLSLVLARYIILPTTSLPSKEQSKHEAEESADSTKDLWIEDTKTLVSSRIKFLSDSPLVLVPGASAFYEKIARSLDDRFDLSANQDIDPTQEVDFFFSVSDIPVWWNRMVVGAILRLSFSLLAFWPLWILGLISGVLLMRYNNKKKENYTILGVCDRGNGPFYSGIYGPYRPNSSFSGTELSCPGLACPKMEDKAKTESHNLTSILKRFSAFNQTNVELLRVVLAHSDYPHFVAEENSIHGEDVETTIDNDNRASKTGFITSEKGTLLQGVTIGLEAILLAHSIAKNYVQALKKNNLTIEEIDKNFQTHIASLKKASQNANELSKCLLFSLTPNRLWAMAEIKPEIMATAYLAIESGKSLVYKRTGSGFTVTSLYPHLQARAVLQSIIPYHQEYNGDTRLILRQAIISCRRHGDFGRSFLPIRMPIEGRAIRDWLETMYAEKEQQQEISYLVELDGHMEEIHSNFRSRLTSRIKSSTNLEDPTRKYDLWMGLVYKSVLLMPLSDLIDTAIQGFHQVRLDRITELLRLTKKFQTKISTSARLPGFKRQAMEADKSGEENDLIVQKIKSLPNGKMLFEHWRIVRRMLTRYNWLSTRIGDDSVPLVGVIHGILKQENLANSSRHLYLDALVPLRERRFVEILGKSWDHTYYRYSPYQDDVLTYTDTNEYDKQVKFFKAEPAPVTILTKEKEVANSK